MDSANGLWTELNYRLSYSKVDVVAEDDNSLGKIEYILITIVKQNFANNRKMQIYYLTNECNHILLSLFKIKELNDLNQKRIYGKNIYEIIDALFNVYWYWWFIIARYKAVKIKSYLKPMITKMKVFIFWKMYLH